jgi:hypothetical protein
MLFCSSQFRSLLDNMYMQAFLGDILLVDWH